MLVSGAENNFVYFNIQILRNYVNLRKCCLRKILRKIYVKLCSIRSTVTYMVHTLIVNNQDI